MSDFYINCDLLLQVEDYVRLFYTNCIEINNKNKVSFTQNINASPFKNRLIKHVMICKS